MDIFFGTKRLSVRRFRSADGDDLAEILTDKEVTYFEPYDTFTHEAAVAEAAMFAESSERHHRGGCRK